MKIKKVVFSTALLTPVAIVPTITSCSIYTDLTKEYKPTYEQHKKEDLTKQVAIDKWFEKANSASNFIKDEINWGYSKVTTHQTKNSLDDYQKGVSYTSKFTSFFCFVTYSKVADLTNHRLSYKINSKVETKDEYFLNDIYKGYGVTHYTVEWECQNIAFDAMQMKIENPDHDYWFIKPVKYDWEKGWVENLSGDEKIIFKIKCITEIYNKDGLQDYGFEATEAGIFDKELSYRTILGNLLDYFSCLFSYYLDNCKLIG